MTLSFQGNERLRSSFLIGARHAPGAEFPAQLREVWLRFHQLDLCQEIDASFLVHPDGIEVWSRVEADKSYQKLVSLLEPLRPTFRVEIYPTVAEPLGSAKDPPPGIWNNEELHRYMEDPFRRELRTKGMELPHLPGQDPNRLLKQRMILFAEQTLGWNLQMKRYALDLPVLTDAAFGVNAPRELHSRAVETSAAHARNLGKRLDRLIDQVALMLPRPEKRASSKPQLNPKPPWGSTPAEKANWISETARSAARRIYRLVYPQQYTVGVVDLREPDLPDSLKQLRGASVAFAGEISDRK
jgi:hypothetical protein